MKEYDDCYKLKNFFPKWTMRETQARSNLWQKIANCFSPVIVLRSTTFSLAAQFDYRSYSTNHNYYPHALIDYRMLNFTHVRPAMFKLNSYRIPIASTMFLNDLFCEFYTYVACVIFFDLSTSIRFTKDRSEVWLNFSEDSTKPEIRSDSFIQEMPACFVLTCRHVCVKMIYIYIHIYIYIYIFICILEVIFFVLHRISFFFFFFNNLW